MVLNWKVFRVSRVQGLGPLFSVVMYEIDVQGLGL